MARFFLIFFLIFVLAGVWFLFVIFDGDESEGRLAAWSLTDHSPEKILEKFYSYGGAEDQLKDPLILGGSKVIPLLIVSVRNREMPRRRYAISFLGQSNAIQALPLLEQLATSSDEDDYIRFDSLEAVYSIDQSRGMELAGRTLIDNSALKSLLVQMQEGTFEAESNDRSWVAAFLAWHD